ncbi:hypothetical protein J6590_004293 [Homalodisca vitripennis]|nr:hypothetical protein J6590_004293 [Homalodisca vitripennis]
MAAHYSRRQLSQSESPRCRLATSGLRCLFSVAVSPTGMPKYYQNIGQRPISFLGEIALRVLKNYVNSFATHIGQISKIYKKQNKTHLKTFSTSSATAKVTHKNSPRYRSGSILISICKILLKYHSQLPTGVHPDTAQPRYCSGSVNSKQLSQPKSPTGIHPDNAQHPQHSRHLPQSKSPTGIHPDAPQHLQHTPNFQTIIRLLQGVLQKFQLRSEPHDVQGRATLTPTLPTPSVPGGSHWYLTAARTINVIFLARTRFRWPSGGTLIDIATDTI